ncbi:hypothetical protein B4U80_10997 [Leptotrombidium deliense]|nr:hypothetical protein B4U80_10997 [Leptotrombidium deliense]
MQRMSS